MPASAASWAIPAPDFPIGFKRKLGRFGQGHAEPSEKSATVRRSPHTHFRLFRCAIEHGRRRIEALQSPLHFRRVRSAKAESALHEALEHQDDDRGVPGRGSQNCHRQTSARARSSIGSVPLSGFLVARYCENRVGLPQHEAVLLQDRHALIGVERGEFRRLLRRLVRSTIFNLYSMPM